MFEYRLEHLFGRNRSVRRPWFQSDPPGGGGGGGGNPPGNPPANPPANPPGTPPGQGGDQDPVRTFKQSELDKLFGIRAREGGETAVKKLLTELGIEKPEDLKAIIQKAKDAENAQKTELQKLQDQLAERQKEIDKLKSEKDTALATATERLMKAAVFAEAGKQNFDDVELASVWTAIASDKALKDKIKVKDDGEFEGIADVVKEVAKAHPRWLKEKSSGIGTPRSGGKPPAGGQQGSGGKTEEDLQEKTRRQYQTRF